MYKLKCLSSNRTEMNPSSRMTTLHKTFVIDFKEDIQSITATFNAHQ